MMTSTPPGNNTNYKNFTSSSLLYSDGLSSNSNASDSLNFDHEQFFAQTQDQSQQNEQLADSNDLMDFVPITNNLDNAGTLQFAGQIMDSNNDQTNGGSTIRFPESFSNSTISSLNSMANQVNQSASSSSVSNNNNYAINANHTPLRASTSPTGLRSKSMITITTTPIQTPARADGLLTTPRRRRAISNASSIRRISKLAEKSPMNGNNPFYTPPSFLSPKIHKHRKQTSISASISLSHLDTDFQLQQQFQQRHAVGSPITTPLRTPGASLDGSHDGLADPEDHEYIRYGDSSGPFIAPSLLIKSKSNAGLSSTDSKFGGKLSDLEAYSQRRKQLQLQLQMQQQKESRIVQQSKQHSKLNQSPSDEELLQASNNFINQNFLENPQDIMLLIDSNNVEDEPQRKNGVKQKNSHASLNSGYELQRTQMMNNRLPRTKSMPPRNVLSSGRLPQRGSRFRITRSRSSMNLSEIAASKEAKNAALRKASASQHQNFPISEYPEVDILPTEMQLEQPPPTDLSEAASSLSTNVYSDGINPLDQYLTPPTTSSSKEGTKAVTFKTENAQEDDDIGAGNTEKKHSKKGKKLTKAKSKKTTTLILTDFERSKLDLPQQSARSKSRSRKSGNDSKKIHECPLCHSRFQRPEHVKRHMRSHSSEKPFACPQPDCHKRFNRKDNLKQHLRKIHGLKG